MEYIVAIVVIAILASLIVYNIKKDEATRLKHEKMMAEIEENNQRILSLRREERRQRILGEAVGNTPPKKRMFEKRVDTPSTPTHVASPTQSMQSYDNSLTDTLVNAMVLNAVMSHHNEPTIRVESDTPSASTSYSKSDDTPSYSSSSRDSSYSSSSSDSSYSSSSSDSSYSSSSSSDW
jgi:type II secretory pathway pseudopilin PulG